MMHSGTLITYLEKLVEQVANHSHKCVRCHENYPCFHRVTYCGVPEENVCPECLAVSDDEEL